MPVMAQQAPASPDKPLVTLVKQSPWVGPVGRFELSVQVIGAPDDAVLSFRLFEDTSSRGRIHFIRTMRGEELGSMVHQPFNVPIANLPTEDNVSLTAGFDIDNARQPFIGFRLTKEGVYPLSVTLQTSDGRELDRFFTSLVRLPGANLDDNPPLSLAVVAPIDAPVALRTDGTSTLDPQVATGLADIIDVLAKDPKVPLTIAPVPETVVALQQRDRSTGSNTVEKLTGAVAGRQVLASPYVRLDLGAWVNSSMDEELIQQFNAGSESLATLLNTRPDRRSWIVDKTVTPQAMAKLRELGVDQVVVPEDQLTKLDSNMFSVTLTRRFELDTPIPRTQAVMADGILRAHIVASDNQVLNANRLLADLAILYLDQPQLHRGAVLLLPENGATPKEFLSILLDALGSPTPPGSNAKPMVEGKTLDELFASTEPAGHFGGRGPADGVSRPEPTLVRGWTSNPPGTLGTYGAQLALAGKSLTSYQSMLGTDKSQMLPLQARLTVSGAAQLDAGHRQAYLDAAVQFINVQAQQVRVPEQQRVTLTSSDGNVPLVLENRLEYPVLARIKLSSDKVDFTRDDDFEAPLLPGTNRIDIPVRIKAAGAIPVNVSVSAPKGDLPMSSGRLPLRSTAISGYGLVLTIGSGLFLVVWWARHFRSTRRHRRLISTGSHPAVSLPSVESPEPSARVDTAETKR